MARRIIDLRTEEEKQGVTGLQKPSQAIAGILETAGRAEKARRESQQLDRIARAIAGGATSIEAIDTVSKQSQLEAILEAAEQPTQFSKGLPGILQRVGGAFQPPGGGVGEGIQRSIISQALKKALTPSLLTPEEQRSGALVKAGLKPRAQAGPVVKTATKQQKQRDKDLATLGSEKKSDFQKQEARRRLDADSSQPRNPAPQGGTFDEFLKDENKEGGKFGKKAHDEALKLVQDDARLQGLDPASAETDFERWWDAKVEGERSGIFSLGGLLERNVTIPRSEFQNATETTQREPSESIEDFLKRNQ